MSNSVPRSLSNNFQDVRLLSLASWSKAAEIVPKDQAGPYVVLQEGYSPTDPSLTLHDFILSRSGKWLALGHFYRLPVPERRAEFVFGTSAEVIQILSSLPSKAAVLDPREPSEPQNAEEAKEELTTMIESKRQKG